MKRLLCLLLSVALIFICAASAWAFTDTAELDEQQLLVLQKLGDLGVVNGYPDGSFRPDTLVSRAEFAKMLCMFTGESPLTLEEDTFIDVAADAWYAGWVARANQQQWISGYPGGEYRPAAYITQQEIATVLVRVGGLSREGFVWPDDYVAAAEQAGFFANFTFDTAEPAGRMIACQMLFNALTPESTETVLVQGVITSIQGQQITIMDNTGDSGIYEAAAGVLPANIFPGAYVEAQVAGKNLVKVQKFFNAKKESAYWDIAIDGTSAVIDGKKYNIEEAEIFIVSYSLSKPYSAATFVKAGMIDRDILVLGGRMAAEMAVILEESGSVLQRAYLVNASVVISGGRLDVVEGAFSSAKGAGISFLGRGGGLPLADGVTQPPAGDFIHYNIRNGEISGYTTLYRAGAAVLPAITDTLKGGPEDFPRAWVRTDGSFSDAALSTASLPQIIDIGSGRNAVQLGTDAANRNYFLADGCLIYEVEKGEISGGSKSSMAKGQQVVALVNQYSEICYMFCIIP